MRKKLVSLGLMMALCGGAMAGVHAQGAPAGGGANPSAQGGTYGSPGMAGATNNTVQGRNASSVSPAITTGGGQGQVPQGGQGQVPQGGQGQVPQGGQGQVPQGGQGQVPQGGQGQVPQGGQGQVPQGGQGQVPQGGQGQVPQGGQGQVPQGQVPQGGGQGQLPQGGQGQAPAFQVGGENGLGGLFSGGLGNLSNTPRPEGLSWLDFGGFGSPAMTPTTPTGASQPLNQQWNPNVDTVPTAPTSLAQTDAAIAAQTTARADSTVTEAQTNAQAAYDQIWSDYYTAVDSTAQTYYDTVTASVDYAQAAYTEAVTYSLTSVDYYVDYAAEYAEYCYYYSWDCYSYTYDSATQTYVDVSYVSDQPTATVQTSSSAATWSGEVTSATSSAQAYEALVVFANDQLGAVVQPMYAGELTSEIQLIMTYLPNDVEGYAALLSSADPAYWGLLNGGVATVGTFDCSTGCTGENIPAELSNAAGGVYMLTVTDAMPADDSAALNLITTVYPAFNGLAFAKVENAEGGLNYMATTYGLGAGADGQGTSVAKLVYAGVMQANGQTFVYTLVAVGQAQIDAFFNQMTTP